MVYKRFIPSKSLLIKEIKGAIKGKCNLTTSIENNAVKPLSKMPSVGKIPYIGAIHHYIPAFGGYEPKMLHELSAQRFADYGPIYKEDIRLAQIGIDYAIWLYDADDTEKVYRADGKIPNRGGFDSLKFYRKMRPDIYKSLGLLILRDTEWYNFRSKVQPVLLKPKIIANYQTSIDSIAEEMITLMRQLRDPETGVVDDLTPELYRYTLESIGLIGLDTRLNCLTNYGIAQQDIVSSVKQMFQLAAEIDESFFWRILKRPIGSKWKKFIDFNDKFTSMVFNHVRSAIQKITSNPDIDSYDDKSVLELFLRRPDCSPEDAVAMVMDMFFAGIDTTAHMIVFTLHYLANHHDIQERLYQEIMTHTNGTGQLDADIISRLSLMRACIKETSRLTPVAPHNSRITKETIVLSNYEIPPNSLVVLNQFVMGRRADYFTDPLIFNPDRWLRENRVIDDKLYPFVVLPFGHGPRMCIGRRIAEMEAVTLLTKIILNFKFTTPTTELPTFTSIISYPQNPMTFTFRERSGRLKSN